MTCIATLKPILKQIAALRRKDVEAKAKQYGLNMEVEADRLKAAEEVLAELADQPEKRLCETGHCRDLYMAARECSRLRGNGP